MQNLLLPTLLTILTGFCLTLPQQASAHKVSSADVVLRIDTQNERYFQLEIATAVESSGDAALDDEIGPVDAARLFVEESLFVLIDEQEQPKIFDAKLIEETDAETPDELKRLSVLVTWRGKLPDNGKELAIFLHETSELQAVLVTEKNGVIKRRYQVIYAGEYSRAENIEPLIKGDPFEIAASKTVASSIEPSKPNPSAFVGGIQACFYNMGIVLIFLVSTLLLSKNAIQVYLLTGLVTICLAIGFWASLAGITIFGIVIIIIFSIDNIVASRFRFWRYLAAAIGAFSMGSYLAMEGPVLDFLKSDATPISFLLGVISCLIITSLIVSLLLTAFRNSNPFKNFLLIPSSIIFAGLALFCVIEML